MRVTRSGRRNASPEASDASQSCSRRSRLFCRDASLSPLSDISDSPEPLPPPIIVCGQVLQPTVVFESLWSWLAERKKIDDARRAGKTAPWTKDKILSKYKFCNAYRVLDRTSQFVVTDVIEKGSQDPLELLFRILLFFSFNRISTWQTLMKAFGELTWATYDLHKYGAVLTAAKNRGQSLCTGAYIRLAQKYEYEDNHMGHLQLLEMFMGKLPDVLKCAQYAADVYEAIAAFPGMGEFTTYQLMLSLSYSKLLNFAANDFVIPGPGASSGLAKMFGRSLKDAAAAMKPGENIEVHLLRHLTMNQRVYFARFNIEFPYLRDDTGGVHLLDVADFEHAVCEVDKYARVKHPQFDGGPRSRKQIKGAFRPSPKGLPAVPRLPLAWKDPARRVSRVRPGPVVVDKMYCCTKITDERPLECLAQDGSEVEYLVWWLGYNDPTWEPEMTIRQDAPEIVEAFLKGKSQKKKRRGH